MKIERAKNKTFLMNKTAVTKSKENEQRHVNVFYFYFFFAHSTYLCRQLLSIAVCTIHHFISSFLYYKYTEWAKCERQCYTYAIT